jgi:hypothetical protein
MKKAFLTIKGEELLGSDGLMFIDGRYNLGSQINAVKQRNERFKKNFPHKVADGFYIVDERLNQVGEIINI